MKWKDKDGKQIGKDEFIERWKQGIVSITPLQQNKVQIRSMILILIGLLGGLIIAVLKIKSLWWLAIIMLASLFNVSMSLIALMQQRKKLKIELEGGIKHGA